MRQESLFWGTMLGAAAGLLGVLALIAGSAVEPIHYQTNPSVLVIAVFIRGLFALVALGICFGMAYYAGIRVGQEMLAANDTAPTSDDATEPGRASALLAGALVMLLYWIVTTIYSLIFPAVQEAPSGAPKAATSQQDMSSYLGIRILIGLFCVVFGAGLGGLGARVPAARSVLRRLVLPATPAPAVTTPESTVTGTAEATTTDSSEI